MDLSVGGGCEPGKLVFDVTGELCQLFPAVNNFLSTKDIFVFVCLGRLRGESLRRSTLFIVAE